MVGADFIPLMWENYYLAWMKEDTKAGEPLLAVLKAGAARATEQQGKRDLSRSGERIDDWREELDWF